MRINIVYCGTINTANERRDFMLMLKYALEANGHDVMLSYGEITDRLNIICGGHNLKADFVDALAACKYNSGIQYAVINTETIADGMLNYKPHKGAGDFNAFIRLLQGAKFIWDVIPQNLEQYPQYGLTAHFLRWGYVPELEEIKHDKPKDLDYYYFGVMSDYSQQTIDALNKAGFKGVVHTGVPYFVRNTYIERAKVCLNLIKDPRFRHVNNFRICYLANNGVTVVSEYSDKTEDPLQYLQYTKAFDSTRKLIHIMENGTYYGIAKLAQAHMLGYPAKDILGELMEKSL